MTFSLVPSQALAEALADASPQATNATIEQVSIADETDESTAVENASEGSETGSGADEVGSESAASVANQSVAAPQPAAETQSVTLSSDAKVYIQDSKDKDNSYSTKSGALTVGETLWANVYDEDPDDWGASSVANPGDWTYTWLASSDKSDSISDYTEVVGHDQSLTVTSDLVGKYFICKVAAGGVDYYGPAKSYGSGINANYIPGPVLGVGQANLYSVKLSASSPSVGDTLEATPYVSYSEKAPEDIDVSYTWYQASSSYGTWTQIEGATGSALMLTEDLEGKYVKVVATAGVNEVEAKTSDAVIRAGAVKLAGVELSASSSEVGATLTARAYTGSSYSPAYVDSSKVIFTWKKYKGVSAPSYSTTWETIEGQTAPTLTVTDDLEGYYVSVSANAGANDVSLSNSAAVGPFKLAGAVDISAVSIVNPADGTSVFTVGTTAHARVRESGAASGVYVDASKLNYQWLVSDTKNGTYTEVAGATSEDLALTDAFEGKYIKCRVSSKVGTSQGENRTGAFVAATGSINVTKAALDASSKAEAGTTLTATAQASGSDVTDDVAWSWYYGDSASSCDTVIDGATTSSFTPDAARFAGKYLQARANGGFGDVKTNAVAIVEAGSVELYGVEVTGATSSGAAHVGSALTARATKGNSYTYVDKTDTVHYQWQYADTKTAADASFVNIPDALDSATYVPSVEMVGKYIRVIATSENSVKSTQKKSYYGTSSVDPVGPVLLEGQYTLKSVAPAEAATATLTAGTVLTPSVRVPGSSSWSDSPAPSDAKLTLTWYARGDADADWVQLTDGVDAASGALTISDALVGKKLKLTASALDNTVEWVSDGSVTAAGEYDLLRVVTSPQLQSSTTKLIAGDTVSAAAFAKRVDGSATNGVDVTSKVSIRWYAADFADAADDAWEELAVSGPSIQVPDAAAGKYLKAVAASGASSVEVVSANPVIAAGSLEAAVQKLEVENASLDVAYSADGANVNDLLETKLEGLGFTDIDVRVSKGGVSFRSEDAKATVGISDADGEGNGAVDFFYMDPNDYTGYNLDQLRRADVTFELSRKGEGSVTYKPARGVSVAWDEDRLQDLLDDVAAGLAIGYANGDSVDSVTSDVTLPYRAGSAKKFSVEWESSDAGAVSISGYGWEDYTGKVSRRSSDRDVTLTAKVSILSNVSGVGITGEAEHKVVVAGDPDKVAADTADLKAKLDAAFDYASVTYRETGEQADASGLTGDLQMPRPSDIGVDGKYYQVSYTADTEDVTFNGYAGTVYRPVPGAVATRVRITCTVTDKSNDEVSASKTLEYEIAPQDASDLAAELDLMERAKAGYAEAILDGQDASAVTGNMHAFQKAYLAADGALAWTYDRSSTDAAPAGIVPVDLPGYDPMAGTSWRLFKTSRADVVSPENLLVTQPDYNTRVTVSSSLSSEKYARYAERYPDSDVYAQLANQPVSATVTVRGVTGLDDPDEGKDIEVAAKVTGPDAEGNDVDWVGETQVTIPAGESWTAAELTRSVLEQNGMTCDSGMWTISAKDGGLLPNGQASLSSAQDESGNWRWWVLYINGQMSNLLATNYYVRAGDVITWVFGDGSVSTLPHEVSFETGGGSAVASQTVADGACATRPEDPTRDGYVFAGWYADEALTSPYDFTSGVTSDLVLYAKWTRGTHAVNGVVIDPSAEGPDWDSDWPGFTSADKVTDAPVPTADAEAKWVEEMRKSTDWSVNVSDPLLVGDYLYIAAGSKLYKKDVETGKTVEGGEAALVSAIDSTSRITYACGLILVPLSGGRLQALTADTLATKWVTDALPRGTQGEQQAISSLTVSGGYAYFGTADADWTSTYGGYLVCVRISDGQVMWSPTNADSAGYYWSGLAVSGSYGVIGDDSGAVSVVDLATGNVVSKLKVAERIRSSVVMDGQIAYVVSNDGVLHKLELGADGQISEVAKVAFGFSSTSTPVLVDGKLIVGGQSVESFKGGYQGKYEYHYGQIAVIDATTMTVEHAVCRADGNYIREYGYDTGGDVKSQPVVSVQGGQTYVYFTSNCDPGCVYRYRVGDEEAEILYTPDTVNQNYCMASISVGSDGSLYYTNDSGKLFAIRGNGQRLPRYTVSFDAGGMDAAMPASQRVKDGHAVIQPVDPKCPGYRFLGWFTADGAEWDFSQAVTGDMTLYAKWESTSAPEEPSKPSDPGTQPGGNGNGSGAGNDNNGNAPKANIALVSNANGGDAAGNASDGEKTNEQQVKDGANGSGDAKSTDASATSGTAVTTSADTGAAESASASQMPVWPFVGIGLGVLAILLIVLLGRKKREN